MSNIEAIIKFNSQTDGRDKLFRLLQYGSRFLWHYAEKRGMDKDRIQKLQSLEIAFSTGRRLIRLGRCLDPIHASLRSLHLQDVALRLTITLSKISMGAYLFLDHIIWLHRSQVIQLRKPDNFNRFANKFWLYSVVLNLLRDIYEFKDVMRQSRGSANTPKSHLLKLGLLWTKHRDLVLDTVKNSCDLVLPLSALGYMDCSAGKVGLFGVISSAIGIYVAQNPCFKLQPS